MRTHGDFRGFAGFKLERDARFPNLANRIEKVYASGHAV